MTSAKSMSTSTETTGHEWDGIKELDTPMPRWWLWTFYATIIWGGDLHDPDPAWPMISGATPGLLGYSSRGEACSRTWRAPRRSTRRSNARLIEADLDTRSRTIPNCCATPPRAAAQFSATIARQCHGAGARRGGRAIPTCWTTTGSGAAPSTTIDQTIPTASATSRIPTPASARCRPLATSSTTRRSTRSSNMCCLCPGQDHDAALADAGRRRFRGQLAACHGEDGKGMTRHGRPEPDRCDLALRRRSRDADRDTITNARFGVMPAMGRPPERGRHPRGRGLRAHAWRRRIGHRCAGALRTVGACSEGVADGAQRTAPLRAAARDATPRSAARLGLRRHTAVEPNYHARPCPHSMPRANRSFRAACREVPHAQMVDHGRDAGDLLPHAVDPLGPRARPAGPGGAGRSGQPALLFLLHRDLAAGILFRRRPSDHGRAGPVPVHLGPRPGLVRLYLPADGLDRPLHPGRTLDRGRPKRPRPALERAVDARKVRLRADEMGGLAADRRRPPAAPGCSTSPTRRRCCAISSPSRRPPVAYISIGDPDRDDLRLRRLHARTGLHLHVPLAAHPGAR